MTDDEAMALAVAEAERALGHTRPNPAVGAVVVRDGVVLGAGCTQPPGQEHAEVMALRATRAAGHDPAGATMYVTLEPCCHHGRTPPCTDAILAAGVRRVVVGVVDPYPPMRGKSLALLNAAGVEVALGVEAARCAELVRGFVRAVERGLPSVTLKAAVSLDGRLATASGESQWITGEAARAHGHGLRSTHDAVLVGIGTALADDPRLTARGARPGRPAPVVVDTELRIPASAQLLRGPERAVILCADDAPDRDVAADVVRVPRGRGGIDLKAGLRALAARGLHRVLVEGGAAIHRSLLDAHLADELQLYAAPMVLPGGRAWVGGAPVERLADAARWTLVEVARLGDDVSLRYRLRADDERAGEG
jgi:diaminohydroxyphosphoribosylaminopyrimidine deaminase/5-amino-6-(5-phosphoribosylamino)uracil reductase